MKTEKIASSEITPKQVYLSRRAFMTAAGSLAVGVGLAACGVGKDQGSSGANGSPESLPPEDKQNSLDEILNYNNYYEFTTDKERSASWQRTFQPRPGMSR